MNNKLEALEQLFGLTLEVEELKPRTDANFQEFQDNVVSIETAVDSTIKQSKKYEKESKRAEDVNELKDIIDSLLWELDSNLPDISITLAELEKNFDEQTKLCEKYEDAYLEISSKYKKLLIKLSKYQDLIAYLLKE